MKKKFLSGLMALAIAIPCAFGLVGCGDDPADPAHTHAYEAHSEYVVVDNKAYHVTEKCSCGDTKKTELEDYVIATTQNVSDTIADATEGTTVVLSTGEYSLLELKGVSFEDDITIVGVSGASVDGVVITSGDDYHWGTGEAPQQVLAKGWTFEQVKFTDGIFVRNGIIEGLTIRGCNFTEGANIKINPTDIRGDATGEWVNEATSGLSRTYYAKNIVIEGNTFVEADETAIYLLNVQGATIRNNNVDGAEYNAIQVATERSAVPDVYTKNLGTILIEGNTLSNTGSRAIRLSLFDDTATLTVKNNVLTNANCTDSNSDVIKATDTNGSTVTFEGNTYNGDNISVGNKITKA